MFPSEHSDIASLWLTPTTFPVFIQLFYTATSTNTEAMTDMFCIDIQTTYMNESLISILHVFSSHHTVYY